MKKTVILFLLSVVASFNLHAQIKTGYTWVLGYPPEPGFEVPYIGGSFIKFKNGTADTSRFKVDGEMSLSSSISDENGDLLFYSNGCEMHNREHQIMTNGNAISAGETYNLVCTGQLGIKSYSDNQVMLTLPWPKHDNMFKAIYIFQPDM